MTSRLHRLPVVVAVLVLFAVASVSAYAAWSTSGTSGATASAATLDAPTGVMVTSVQGSGSVAVSWSPPSGPLVPQGYTVRRTSGGTSTYACGTSPSTLVTGLSCTDTGIPDATYT